jgi:hypothetical protein
MRRPLSRMHPGRTYGRRDNAPGEHTRPELSGFSVSFANSRSRKIDQSAFKSEREPKELCGRRGTHNNGDNNGHDHDCKRSARNAVVKTYAGLGHARGRHQADRSWRHRSGHHAAGQWVTPQSASSPWAHSLSSPNAADPHSSMAPRHVPLIPELQAGSRGPAGASYNARTTIVAL